jgi:hypothetical protein
MRSVPQKSFETMAVIDGVTLFLTCIGMNPDERTDGLRNRKKPMLNPTGSHNQPEPYK